MGAGGAVTSPQDHHAQVPRLTAMLRAFAIESGSLDVGALYLQRTQALEAKRLQLASKKAGTLGSSPLARKVLGSWTSAPKLARDDYERYLKTVSSLLGGEASSEELQATAEAVWEALKAAPGPEDLNNGPRITLAAKLMPHRKALEKVVGAIEEKDLLDTLKAVAKLRTWQKSVGSTADSGSAAQAKGQKAAVASPERKEFGADLEFHFPRLQPRDDEAELDALANHSQASALTATPESLRQMFTANLGQDAPAKAYLEDDDADEFAPKAPQAKTGAVWLRSWCARAAGGGDSQGDDSVALAVARVILTAKSGDEAAANLFDLYGDTAFEAIEELLSIRKPLAANLRQQIAAQMEVEAAEKPKMPTYGSSVSIMSESQKLLGKLERKDKRRVAKGKAGADAELDWLSINGLDALVESEIMRDSKTQGLVVGDLEFKIAGDAGGMQTRGALPKGTKRQHHKGYEEVKVPAAKKSTPEPGERVVLIEEMEEWAQLAFTGYKSLNRIQSRIYPTAFGSNENLLVCAPTGAGKTNIAMISVLREIGANMRQGVIQKHDFKIVYVAPMKALAAEVTATFSRRLSALGIVVRELTGDMQLSKRELTETQMIVTTPEKWDVITRKGGDVAVAAAVRLLIIDEVHLLNDERGPVIETLIARTQRQVEASQSMIRIVGLSATLPNYKDVAMFLGVNVDSGLFYFDASYRPVPLEMQFVGVTEKNVLASKNIMDELCYQKVVDSLRKGHQAMVFVHSRKDTGKTARTLVTKAQNAGETDVFDCSEEPQYPFTQKEIKRSRNREIQDLFPGGIGIHHAGMLRSDRNLMEKAFADGMLKVLCTTATLAWGVNLPAHTVIIKGTQLYDAQKGAFKNLGMLDVQQIFGRAGRPQYEDTGLGIILTQHAQLAHYLGMLTHQLPIESQFVSNLEDNLNAEIVLGTVTNVKEACAWLSYTYLFVRMLKNPLAYGVPWEELAADQRLEGRRKQLITDAARKLERCRMARFDERSGQLYVTELGRVASHFYIRHKSIVAFNELLKPHMTESEFLAMLAQSSEFENMAVREEELPELDNLVRSACPFEVKGGPENKHGKINILLQAYVSRARMESFSLTADMMYVSQNAPRICRALFEICLRRSWSTAAELALTLCKAFEKRLWPHQHALRQFENALNPELLMKLEDRGLDLDRLWDMEASEIGSLVRHPAAGKTIAACLEAFPALQLDAQLQPITRTVLRVQVTVQPTFQWRDASHGNSMQWHIWVEDSENEHVYHSETWTLTKKMMREPEHRLAFTIPIFEPLPPQYYIRAVSDTWLQAEATLPMSFKGLILPERHPPHTELLDLDPLPLSALDCPLYESQYRFSHFNPIQTQAFHTLYHTDESVLLGAPTGSGKTISSELAMLRVFRAHPGKKVIYIAPLKALVRERIKDWGQGLCKNLGKKLVELTGEYTPDMRALMGADVIICTPEKWDGISRAWHSRSYVKQVCLLVIDEIHLLGADRGPILEVIVSRMRYIAATLNQPIRFVGLSTALANAADLADWLGIGPKGLFNFKPSVRPVPLECHIQGFPGKFYCPRMATMNKPAYAAIQTHSPIKPVLVFVSSRRQTRLTALDLIGYAAADERPRQFVHCPEEELEEALASIKDGNLRHTLQFGIGLHHAGLNENDRSIVENMFVAGKIQVLVATSTLAWGVNSPTHLVIIKGTEYFDAPTRRYVDFPITDVLQMMGRAGRPQYDRHGVAVIMVHEPKKSFYKKFLYEPFPVESSLPDQVADHFNAEVVAGTIASKQDAIDYLTWTFFYRRLLQNPSYYNLESTEMEDVSDFLSDMVETTMATLQDAGCLTIEDFGAIAPLTIGRVASFYYLKYQTMATLHTGLHADMAVPELLGVLCAAAEYDELPVRHNEDKLNMSLSAEVRFPIDVRSADDPHAKASLLLQAHMGRVAVPISDYVGDTKGALDNSVRVLQAITDLTADAGWLGTTLSTMHLIQGLMQARWWDENPLLILPRMEESGVQLLASRKLPTLPQLLSECQQRPPQARAALEQALGSARAAEECMQVCSRLPLVDVSWQAPRPVRDVRQPDVSTSGLSGSGSRQRFVLEVELRQLRGSRGPPGASKAYAPLFPKVKEAGWWLVLGDGGTQELHALKRMSFSDRATARLSFTAASAASLSNLHLYLVSDSYMGLDQSFCLGAPPTAQHHGKSTNRAERAPEAGQQGGEHQMSGTGRDSGNPRQQQAQRRQQQQQLRQGQAQQQLRQGQAQQQPNQQPQQQDSEAQQEQQQRQHGQQQQQQQQQQTLPRRQHRRGRGRGSQNPANTTSGPANKSSAGQ
ncbi:g3645 [Coccomyxa elongata]